MSGIEAIVIVALVAVGTYLSRGAMILLLADRELPDNTLRALRQVGPAVLAALVVTFVADPSQANRGVSLAEGAALVVSCGVHWRWKSLLVTLIAGMSAFWLVRGLSG